MSQYMCLYKCEVKTERKILVRAGAAYASLQRALNNASDDDDTPGRSSTENETSDNLSNSGDADDYDGEDNSMQLDGKWCYPDINYLRLLDPKDWKKQDHYKVLGLENLRIEASEDDIRRAYRRMLLFHHPDKRKPKGEVIDTEDDYFSCITRAYEILGTPKKRRAYDSVDPTFDNTLPTQDEINNDFYGTFERQFRMNSRWSENKIVPLFGDENSSREEVENFYTFWYNFKSWREYSYLDEEDKERGQDRDERRFICKENKLARAKHKKEEALRIRSLVDLAYNNDKRIQKFKTEEKEKKIAMKKAKMEAQQAVKAQQERSLRAAEMAKKEAEEAEQKRIEQLRIEKEHQKKALKKERKLLRDRLKDANYFMNCQLEESHQNNNNKNHNDTDKKVRNIEGMEKICELFSLLEIRDLNKQFLNDNQELCRSVFLEAISEAEIRYTDKMKELDEKYATTSVNDLGKYETKRSNSNDDMPTNSGCVTEEIHKWSAQDIQLLVKAVNLFPAGTIKRWDVVTTYLTQHSITKLEITPRDVLNKVKMLQSQRQAAVSYQYCTAQNESNMEKIDIKQKETNGHIPQKNIAELSDTEHITNSSKSSITKKAPVSKKLWTNEEQLMLEQAMKNFPQSTPDRWDRVAECIPTRTKKECLRRVKELIELVGIKAKKQGAATK